MLKAKLKQILWISLASALAAVPLAACNGRGDRADPSGGVTFTPPLQVHTRVEAKGLQMLAADTVQLPQGRSAVVHCLVRRGGSWVENVPWRVESEPPMRVTQRNSVEVRLVAPQAGTYRLRCVAGTGEGVHDAQGVTLVVQGPPGPDGDADAFVGDSTSMGQDDDGEPTPTGWPVGKPYRWNARWDDADQDLCYAERRPFMLLSPAVYDAHGYEVPDPPIRITARDPAVTILERPYGVSFSAPGTYEVTAYVEGAESPKLQPVTRVFEVDSTPPTITILSPERGAPLATPDSPATVMVHGVIEDASGLGRASFNGQPLALTPGATRHEFFQPVNPKWGVNVFKVQATDRCEVPALHAQSFTRSSAYGLPPEPVAAVRARFGPEILDDRHAAGDAQGESSDASLAGLAQRALQPDHFNAVFPEHLSASPAGEDGKLQEVTERCGLYTRTTRKSGYEVLRRGDFRYESARVTRMEAVSGQWEAEVTFSNLRLPVRINWYTHIWCVATPKVGWVDAEVEADTFTVALKVERDPDSFALRIPSDSFAASFDDRSPRINYVNKDAGVSALPDGLMTHLHNGAFRHVYLNVFERSLTARLHEELEAVLVSFVGGLRMERAVEVPLPWEQEQGKMLVGTAVDHLEVSDEHGERTGELGLQAVFNVPDGDMDRGVIRAPAGQPDLRLQGDQTVSFAVYDDFVNRGLHAMWQRGSFNVTDLPQALALRSSRAGDMGQRAVSLEFVATTPPVLMPGASDQEVIVGWGDAHVRGKFNTALLSGKEGDAQPGIAGVQHPDVEVGLYCSILLRGTLEMDGVTQSLHLVLAKDSPHIDLHVVSMSNPLYKQLASSQLEHFARNVRPHLETALRRALPELTAKALRGVPLPLFKFDGTPIRWRLESPELTREAGGHYSVLRGRLSSDDLHPQNNVN